MGEELADSLAALCISTVNPAVRANDQAVEIVNQSRVARFRSGNRQVRCRASINSSQLLYLFAMELAQRHAVEELEQFLEPLPDVFALVYEFIDGHCT